MSPSRPLIALALALGLCAVSQSAFVTPNCNGAALLANSRNMPAVVCQSPLAPVHKIQSQRPAVSLRMSEDGQVSRRQALASLAATSVVGLGQVQAASAAGAPVLTKTSDTAVVPLTEFKDAEAGFSIALPKFYFKSSRGKKLGTLFVAGNLQTAQIISVQRLSVEKLLADVGVVPTGDLSSWPSIGSAAKVAELLAFVRDGDAKQQSGLPSKVEADSVKLDGNILRFKMVTPIAVQRPDKLKESQGITELNRITEVRAELTPPGQTVIVWASALEKDYNEGAAALLRSVASSLTLLPSSPAT